MVGSPDDAGATQDAQGTFPHAGAGDLTTLRGMSIGVLRGRCACNAIAFEVADGFVVAYNCHCSNCRALTGSAFLPWGEIEPES